MGSVVLGVDVGTSSSKGVLVDEDGKVLISTTRTHRPARPRPGHVEMDARIWWTEFTSIAQELLGSDVATGRNLRAVGLSGMGPCTVLADAPDDPADDVGLRPAILYGVDTRAHGRSIGSTRSSARTPIFESLRVAAVVAGGRAEARLGA